MSKKTKIFLVIEILVVLLVIGGVVFYVMYEPKEPKEELTQEEREQRAIEMAANQLMEQRAKQNESEKRYQNAVNRASETEQNLREAEMQTYGEW